MRDMTLTAYDGFSVDLPAGWREIGEDASYSDPTEGDRRMFGRPGEAAVIYIALVPIDPDSPPSASPEYVEALALGWGRARGLSAPVTISASEHPEGAMARAEYKLAADYVAVWFLTNGELTLCISYVCGWRDRDSEREVREALVGSITFA